jgi:hypothetical protein
MMTFTVMDAHLKTVRGSVEANSLEEAMRFAKVKLRVWHPVIDLLATPDGRNVYNSLIQEANRLKERFSDA